MMLTWYVTGKNMVPGTPKIMYPDLIGYVQHISVLTRYITGVCLALIGLNYLLISKA